MHSNIPTNGLRWGIKGSIENMGYLFLTVSLLAGATKGYCGKKTSGYVSGYKDAVLSNIIRMVFCVLIGFAITAVRYGPASVFTDVDVRGLLIAVLSGVTTAGFIVTWLISVKKGAYMMLDVFLMLGVIIPLLGSLALFDEAIKLTQWLGLGVLLIAAAIMCSYNNSIKEKLSLGAVVLLILCGTFNGLTDFSQKLFVEQKSQMSIEAFNFYTYGFTTLVLGIAYAVLKKRDKTQMAPADFRSIFLYIFVMAICLFANSYFKTIAAQYLPSTQLYPLSQGMSLVLSTVMAAVFFKEKINVKSILGISLAFVGLLIINLL